MWANIVSKWQENYIKTKYALFKNVETIQEEMKNSSHMYINIKHF